jgi:hypothetical protein
MEKALKIGQKRKGKGYNTTPLGISQIFLSSSSKALPITTKGKKESRVIISHLHPLK